MSSKAVIRTFETNAHRILMDDDIIRIHAKSEQISVDAVKEVFVKLDEIVPEGGYIIIDPTEDRSFPKAARKLSIDWFNSRNHTLAIMVKSWKNKIVFDFMTSVLKPNFKYRAFDNIDPAISWLREERNGRS